MQAMILAAGEGQRLRPLTLHTPKPLIPVAGKSMLRRWFERLGSLGVEHIVINTCYLHECFQGVERYAVPGQRVSLIHESRPLGAAGGVRNALSYLKDEPFLLISCDIWCEWDDQRWSVLPQLMGSQPWRMLLGAVTTKADYSGDFDCQAAEIGPLLTVVSEFQERVSPVQLSEITPAQSRPYQYAGIAWVKKAAFEHLALGSCYNLGSLINRLSMDGLVFAAPLLGSHWDMGTLAQLKSLEAFFVKTETPQSGM